MKNLFIVAMVASFLSMPAIAAKKSDGDAKQSKNKAVRTFGADKYDPAPGKPFRKTKK